MARKEDARFIRGQGTYVDDVQLPGMLHGAILRSPYAHARIVSIDTTAALQHPRVHAVITGSDLEARGLAWMPTMSHDTQAVLATDKVRYQGQEVAFVIADDRYCARDALELIDVEYEPLPVVVDAAAALDPDAPLIRDDREGQIDNHIFDWEAGDAAATDDVFARADVVVEQDMRFPRSHPAPMETCGAVASYDKVAEKLTLWCTTQAPHAHRTVYALLTGHARAQDPRDLARHRRRLWQQGAGVSGLRVRAGRLDRDRQAGEVDGGSLGESDVDRVCARLCDEGRDRGHGAGQDPRRARGGAGRPRRVQHDRAADQLPGRVLPRVHRLLRPAGRALPRARRLHQQGARRRRVRVLVPDRRGGVPRRADGRLPGARARRRSRAAAACKSACTRAVPVPVQDRLGV